MATSSSATAQLLDQQLDAVVAMHRQGQIDGLQLQSIDASVRELFEVQGGCERIK
jgi:predicted membrane chloride channel (bestrophin family)